MDCFSRLSPPRALISEHAAFWSKQLANKQYHHSKLLGPATAVFLHDHIPPENLADSKACCQAR